MHECAFNYWDNHWYVKYQGRRQMGEGGANFRDYYSKQGQIQELKKKRGGGGGGGGVRTPSPPLDLSIACAM